MADPTASRLWRLSGIGFTLASEIVAGALMGWGLVWVLGQFDESWSTHTKLFIAVGAICGIVVGLYSFIKSSLRAVRENSPR
jgi:F0F1-type ATP synthase assembly protein I